MASNTKSRVRNTSTAVVRPKGNYKSWLTTLKQNISSARLHTSLQVNANMLMVYGYIGKEILDKQEKYGWGSGVIRRLAKDLQRAFPDTKGFSERNLVYMRQFAAEYTQDVITQTVSAKLAQAAGGNKKKAITQTVSAKLEKLPVNLFGHTLPAAMANSVIFKISWSHHVLLLDKINNIDERLWYIEQSVKNGWSVRVPDYQISTDLYQRQYKKKRSNNFHLTLPKKQSDLANQILKDPYNFDFLQISESASERELEIELTRHIEKFLLELGAGFAYVGRQFKLKLGRKEYFLDLLFYHLYLRCFIVIDLKIGEFEPEFVGKMNAYLNALNKEHCQPHDNPSIGIILCNSKDEIEVEYALQGLQHPIGVSEYRILPALPKKLRDKLPSPAQFKKVIQEFNAMYKR